MTRHFLFIYVILNKKESIKLENIQQQKNIRKMFEIKKENFLLEIEGKCPFMTNKNYWIN